MTRLRENLWFLNKEIDAKFAKSKMNKDFVFPRKENEEVSYAIRFTLVTILLGFYQFAYTLL